MKVGILLAIHSGDNPDWFEASLKSLINQTHFNLLVLILKDGNIPEELQKVISKFKDDRLIELSFNKNRGLAAVLNDGIKYCQENNIQYIARMDADDISHIERIRKQFDFLLSNPEVDVVGTAIEEFDEKGKSYGKIVQYPLSHDDCKRFFKKRDPLAHPAVMFKSSYFEKAGLYNPEYRKNQDTVLWYQGFMNGCNFANIPEPMLKFRITEDFYKYRRSGWKRAKKMFEDRLRINHDLKYGYDAYLYAIGMFILTLLPSGIKKIAYKFLR